MSIAKKIVPVLLTSCLLAISTGNTIAAEKTKTALKKTPVTKNGAYLKRAEVKKFIEYMGKKHAYDKKQLTKWFSQIRPRPDIIKAISHPAEGLPWHRYRPIFMREYRIKEGIQFWNKHEKILKQAEKKLGVPPSIIVAILGVETRYGKYKGKHLVLESLSTLAFDYPRRARFFRKELEEFLLLVREEKKDALKMKGSYAGAMGGPQFISSSFRAYAIDFDGDGKRDLWNNTTDMIGSVANYFKVHGWKPGGKIITRARISGKAYKKIRANKLKPELSIAQLKASGIRPAQKLTDEEKAALIRLEYKHGPDYWLGLNNFYVITRYNHSELYAMAVYQLSLEMSKRRKASKSKS